MKESCPRCGSGNIRAQIVTETRVVEQRPGCIWWLLIGWWWVPVKWICFTGWALLAALLRGKRQKIHTTHTGMWVCQDCGHIWRA